MSISVFLDLDGTLFDLYGKPNWLEMLESENPAAFEGDFLPEIDIDELYSICESLLMAGVKIGIITWLPMNASPEYERECARVKREWVAKNLPFITDIKCQSYGTPKQNAITKRAKSMYLIDDNIEICKAWVTEKMRKAINVDREFTVVDALKEIYWQVTESEI